MGRFSRKVRVSFWDFWTEVRRLLRRSRREVRFSELRLSGVDGESVAVISKHFARFLRWSEVGDGSGVDFGCILGC